MGHGELQEELNALSKRGEWLQMAGRIDDSLLERIAVVGSSAEIGPLLRARCGSFADRVSPVAAIGGDAIDWVSVVKELKQAS